MQNEECKVENAKFTPAILILQFLFFTLHFAIRAAAEPADRVHRAAWTFSAASLGPPNNPPIQPTLFRIAKKNNLGV